MTPPADLFPEVDTPQALVDLDMVDRNAAAMLVLGRANRVNVRVHFKSLKCGGLARYQMAAGFDTFLCAKLCEAEVLGDIGVKDVLVANQVVGPAKLRRLTTLARRADVSVCVDDAGNVDDLAAAARAAGVSVDVVVEVDVGQRRCGVDPGAPAAALARNVLGHAPALRFRGLQGYAGHIQMLPDPAVRVDQCRAGLQLLLDTRRALEAAGIPVVVVTGAGTGTAAAAAGFPGLTEIQPGSFVLMDAAYHAACPAYGCALSILSTVVSRRAGRYVLDAGSKAVSKDFGTPVIKDRPADRVTAVNEEHTVVAPGDYTPVRVGDRREVLPAHCCATMNLHRSCAAVRGGRVEAVWPVEASGRYD
jgi:D-serine deaminase-like pyridoxal phosphate-dependent protein